MLQIWLLYDVYFLESAYVMSKPYSLATICVLINTHLVIMFMIRLMPALVPCRKKVDKTAHNTRFSCQPLYEKWRTEIMVACWRKKTLNLRRSTFSRVTIKWLLLVLAVSSDCVQSGETSRYTNNHQGQLSLPSLRVSACLLHGVK